MIPIISGLFNEVNNSTMALIESMAASRVDKLVRSSGLQFRAREKERGEVVGELRVLFSVTSLRSAQSLILSRLNQVGDSAALVSKRREATRQVEEARRGHREAQHLARVWGGPLVRKGHFFRQ